MKNGLCCLQQVHEDYDCMLNQTNIGHNNNKFYVVQVINVNNSYYTWNRWGRVVSLFISLELSIFATALLVSWDENICLIPIFLIFFIVYANLSANEYVNYLNKCCHRHN